MVEKLRTHLQKVDELEHHDLKPFFQVRFSTHQDLPHECPTHIPI
jgi:hypothetical protein